MNFISHLCHSSFLIVGLTASCFGLGATLSNFLGQMVVEKMGHVASLSGSFLISIVPVVLFSLGMPETYGHRGNENVSAAAPAGKEGKNLGTSEKSVQAV